MVGRIETGAGVGLFHYEFTAVLVTDQEQHWLTMRYPPAVPRRHGQVLGLDRKQRRTGAGVEALKLSGEYSPSRHLYSQRTDLPSVIKHGEHGTVGDDQSLQVSGVAANPLDTHAHHGVLPGLDGRWQCGWWQIGERRRRLEASKEETSAILSQRRAVRNDVEAIVARAQDMTEFLKRSEMHERRAFAETFVKEIVVMPGKVVVRYNVPMPDDSHTPGADSEEILLGDSVTSAGGGGRSFTESALGRYFPDGIQCFHKHTILRQSRL